MKFKFKSGVLKYTLRNNLLRRVQFIAPESSIIL